MNSNAVTITVNPLPAASVISNTAICIGNSISIGTTAVTGSSYSWTSSFTGFSATVSNPSVNPTSTSSYTLTETNANGCVNSNTVNITVNPLPAVSVISNTAICTGNSISIGAAAVTGSTYSWASSVSGFSSTAANPSVSPTSTRSFTLTETNTNGCVNSNSVTITVNPLPAASIISSTSICSGNSISIGSSSISGDTYSSTSTDPGFSSTSSNPSASPTSTSSYTLTETNSNGCLKSNSVTITVNPLPSASVIANTTICSMSSIYIGAYFSSGHTYSWTSSPSGFTSTLSDPQIFPSVSATYTLKETITATGCSKSDSVTITADPLPSASVISSTTICLGSSISLGATAVSGHTYSWSDGTRAGFTSTSSNPTVSPTIQITYVLNETNTATGCNKSNYVTINVNPAPSATVVSHAPVCQGTSVSIGTTSVSGDTYLWTSYPSGFASTLSNPTVTPTKTTIYTLTETITATGCRDSDSVAVSVNPLPPATVIANTTICSGAFIYIGGKMNSNDYYAWSSSPPGLHSAYADPDVDPTVTTKYTLKETIYATGCSDSNSVTITVNPLPAAAAISNTTICAGSAISIGGAAVSGSTYSWTSSCFRFQFNRFKSFCFSNIYKHLYCN